MAGTEAPSVILYKASKQWGLPSLSVACIQVEAYLRLAQINFAVQECSTPSASPTGQVPALDTSADLVGADVFPGAPPPLAEFAAARVLINYLKDKVADLDRGLSATQRAEATAFTALLEGKLQPALVYSTWCEDEAFAQHTRGAVAAALPFPLSQLVPRLQRRAVQQYFAARSSDDVYQGAADALDALALRLETGGSGSKGGGGFFFGSRPSTIDALLYACLAYVHAAPVVHPQLRQKLDGHRSLVAYLERCSQRAFSAGAPAAAEASFDFTAWASSQAADDKWSKSKTERESELQRKGRRWLICAAAAIAAYIFLSGQYIQLDVLGGLEYEDEEDED